MLSQIRLSSVCLSVTNTFLVVSKRLIRYLPFMHPMVTIYRWLHNNRLFSDPPTFYQKITMPSYAWYFSYSVNTKIHSEYTVIRVEELNSVHLKCLFCIFFPCLLNIYKNWLYNFPWLCSSLPKVRWVMLYGFVANFIRFLAVQKFWKSVKIWQSYREF